MMDDFDFDQYYEELNNSGKSSGGGSGGMPPPGGRPRGGFRSQTLFGGSFSEGSRQTDRSAPAQGTSERLRERYRQAQPLFGQAVRRFRPSFMDNLPALWGIDLAFGLLTLLVVVGIIIEWECVSIAIVSNILQILSAVLTFLTLALIGMFLFRSVFRRGRFF